jgi:hypothetical protein
MKLFAYFKPRNIWTIHGNLQLSYSFDAIGRAAGVKFA